MKFVYKTNDPNQANSIKHLLQENGIPVNVMGNSMRNRGTHIPQGIEVRIYLNEQYSDALQLIKNPEHKVANPVNIDEFYELLDSEHMENKISSYNFLFLKYGIGIIAIFIIALMLVL